MPPDQALSDYLKLSAKTSTFVSIDVVGSTQVKTGQNEQDIIYTFLAYHKLASDLAYTHHGEVCSIAGISRGSSPMKRQVLPSMRARPKIGCGRPVQCRVFWSVSLSAMDQTLK